MKKYTKRENTLIKANKLQSMLKKQGIQRTSPKALNEINKKITLYVTNLIESSKESMIVNGRKTLKKEDIEISKKENLFDEI